MSVRKRRLRAGIRWAYDKTVRKRRLLSPFVYLTKTDAVEAEAQAVKKYLQTGKAQPISGGTGDIETVSQLYARWVKWLEHHRSPRHAYNMRSLLSRSLAQNPDAADMPAGDLAIDDVEAWADAWGADLLERGRTRKTVNDWLRYSQTAFNPPWGRRRAVREYEFNPFKYVDRYQVEYRAKYVPSPAEVDTIRLAAGGEFRLYLEIMIDTAARPGEALSLAWEDIGCDESPPWIILHTRKTADGSRRPRRLEISGDLAARLRSHRRTVGDGRRYLFQQDHQIAPRHEVWARKNHIKTCRRAERRPFPLSCYRHYRISKWDLEGLPLASIQARAGHARATTTDHYLHELRAL